MDRSSLQDSGHRLLLGFPRQEHWSGLPFSSPGDLPDPGINTASPALAGIFFTTEPPGKPLSYMRAKSLQSCPTLCDPIDCSTPGSSLHGILQARIPEWIAISFSRGPSRPRDQTQVTLISGRCFTIYAAREAPPLSRVSLIHLF